MTETNYLSFNPADASVGGNLNDIDATIVSSRIVPFDYNGKAEEMMCCWAIGYRPWDAESDDDIAVDYIRLGTMAEFTPSPESAPGAGDGGKRAVPVSSKNKLHKDSKTMQYTRALIAAGFQANQLGVDVSVIEGLNVHLATIQIKGGKDKSGKDVEGKVTLVTKIHEKGPANTGARPAAAKSAAAGKTAPAAGKAATTTTAAPAAAAAGVDPAISDKAAEFVFNEIANAGGTLAKSMLPGKAFRAFQGDERNAIVGAINKAEWIGAAERPWKVNGANLVVE